VAISAITTGSPAPVAPISIILRATISQTGSLRSTKWSKRSVDTRIAEAAMTDDDEQVRAFAQSIKIQAGMLRWLAQKTAACLKLPRRSLIGNCGNCSMTTSQMRVDLLVRREF
jgi:hypothetical protein